MSKRTLTVITILTAMAIGASAQTNTAPTVAQIVADRVARLTKLLTLTTTQQASATAIFTTEVTAKQALEPSVTAAETALESAILANSASGIATAAAQIGTLKTQGVTAYAKAQAAFYAILTTDQQSKYTVLKGAGPDGHGGGRDSGGHHGGKR